MVAQVIRSVQNDGDKVILRIEVQGGNQMLQPIAQIGVQKNATPPRRSKAKRIALPSLNNPISNRPESCLSTLVGLLRTFCSFKLRSHHAALSNPQASLPQLWERYSHSSPYAVKRRYREGVSGASCARNDVHAGTSRLRLQWEARNPYISAHCRSRL